MTSFRNIIVFLFTDDTDFRFPVAVMNEPSLRDVRVSVRCRTISGRVDQACGLVARYRDENNYYVTRANALEGNVRLYHTVQRSRVEFASGNATVQSGTWSTLEVQAAGNSITVSWNGTPVISNASDSTFAKGKIGLWTKADSVTAFDDLEATAQ